jgi:hypothetical protein
MYTVNLGVSANIQIRIHVLKNLRLFPFYMNIFYLSVWNWEKNSLFLQKTEREGEPMELQKIRTHFSLLTQNFFFFNLMIYLLFTVNCFFKKLLESYCTFTC